MFIELYQCRNIFSKYRKQSKLAPGMLKVKKKRKLTVKFSDYN